jgi:5-methylcytosine-specific restriction protein A
MDEQGCLACVPCSFDFAATYGEVGKGFIECHHLRRLAELAEEGISRLHDLTLLAGHPSF